VIAQSKDYVIQPTHTHLFFYDGVVYLFIYLFITELMIFSIT